MRSFNDYSKNKEILLRKKKLELLVIQSSLTKIFSLGNDSYEMRTVFRNRTIKIITKRITVILQRLIRFKICSKICVKFGANFTRISILF